MPIKNDHTYSNQVREMIALSLNTPEDLAEAIYLSRLSIRRKGKGRLWANLSQAKRQEWIATADRLIKLHQAEGLTISQDQDLKQDLKP